MYAGETNLEEEKKEEVPKENQEPPKELESACSKLNGLFILLIHFMVQRLPRM